MQRKHWYWQEKLKFATEFKHTVNICMMIMHRILGKEPWGTLYAYANFMENCNINQYTFYSPLSKLILVNTSAQDLLKFRAVFVLSGEIKGAESGSLQGRKSFSLVVESSSPVSHTMPFPEASAAVPDGVSLFTAWTRTLRPLFRSTVQQRYLGWHKIFKGTDGKVEKLLLTSGTRSWPRPGRGKDQIGGTKLSALVCTCSYTKTGVLYLGAGIQAHSASLGSSLRCWSRWFMCLASSQAEGEEQGWLEWLAEETSVFCYSFRYSSAAWCNSGD